LNLKTQDRKNLLAKRIFLKGSFATFIAEKKLSTAQTNNLSILSKSFTKEFSLFQEDANFSTWRTRKT